VFYAGHSRPANADDVSAMDIGLGVAGNGTARCCDQSALGAFLGIQIAELLSALEQMT